MTRLLVQALGDATYDEVYTSQFKYPPHGDNR